jgi:hypothetical protein
MSDELALTIVFEPGEDGWVIASIPEVAGVSAREAPGADDQREREQLHLTIAA